MTLESSVDTVFLSVTLSHKRDLRFLKKAVQAAGVRPAHAAEIVAAALGYRGSQALQAAMRHAFKLNVSIDPLAGVDRAAQIIPDLDLSSTQADAIEGALYRGHVELELRHAQGLFDRLFKAAPLTGATGDSTGAAVLKWLLAMHAGDPFLIHRLPHILVLGHGKTTFVTLAHRLTKLSVIETCTPTWLLQQLDQGHDPETAFAGGPRGVLVDAMDTRTLAAALDVMKMSGTGNGVVLRGRGRGEPRRIDLMLKSLLATVPPGLEHQVLTDLSIFRRVRICALQHLDPNEAAALHRMIGAFLDAERLRRLATLLHLQQFEESGGKPPSQGAAAGVEQVGVA